MRPTFVMLAVTAAVVGSLLGLGPEPLGAPRAAACESKAPQCRGDDHAPPSDGDLVIRGTLTTVVGVIVVDARSVGGQVDGVATLALGPTGPVREIRPPGDGRDFYCVNIERDGTPGLRANFYIRDVGDGVTTFDQAAVFAGDPELTCSNGTPPASFPDGVAGDITVTR